MPRFAPSSGAVGLDDSPKAGPSSRPARASPTVAATSTPTTHSPGIKSISKSDIHRITSGQVVLDLQSAVKELVENSLDAGSTSLEIRFKNFGLDGFEVIDNGTGIKEEDYASVALKHHTSKLEDFDDLTTVTTFGFRGEALSSLCAHATVTILTATKQQAPMGTLLEFAQDGSLSDSTKKMARQRGCTVSVNDLFHSLPVRRRELEKHSRREYGKVQALLQAYALISKGVRWNVYNTTKEGRKTAALAVSSASTGDWLYKNYASVFGPKSTAGLRDLDLQLEMKDARGGLTSRPRKKVKVADPSSSDSDSDSSQSRTTTLQVTGLISHPTKQAGRTTSDRQFFYINGRPWDNVKLSRVCNDVFRSFNHTTSTAVPVVIADFALRTDGYDVNVSPDKRTIFLHQEKGLLEAFRRELEALYEPSRGTFVVNGTTQQTHTQQTQLGFAPVRGADGAEEDAEEEDVDDAEDDQDGRDEHDGEDARLSTGDDPSQDAEMVDDGELREPEMVDSAQPHGVVRHKDGDEEQAEEEEDDYYQAYDDPGDDPDEGEDDDMPPPQQPRAARSSMQPPPTSSTASQPSTSRSTFTPPARQSRIQVATRTTAQSQSAPPRASIATLLTGFSRPGSQVAVVSRGDEEQDVVDEQRDREEEVVDDGAEDLREELDDQDAHVDGDAADDATRLRSKHVSTVPSSDADIADEEREAHLQELDEAGECAVEPEETTAVSYTQAASSGTVVVDMAVLRRQLRGPLQSDPDSDSDDDGPLYVNPSAVAAAARRDSSTTTSTLSTTAGLSNSNSTSATTSLQRTITQPDFSHMQILGQFNLGFIIVRLRNDLFIIDQHASDEKYNFETLQSTTKIRSQKLISPRVLELSSTDELVALQHIDTIRSNGFEIDVDEEALPGSRVRLVSQPVSKDVVFGVKDLEELLYLLRGVGAGIGGVGSSTATATATPTIRCSKARAMFASRACRKSVMIGTALSMRQMVGIVRRMGEIEQPWNCPHGRPTMRHLVCLGEGEDEDGEGDGETIQWGNVLAL